VIIIIIQLNFKSSSSSPSYIVETGMEKSTIGEKNILVMCEPCAFTIHLYSTHKDTQNLYLVLEPALGGELYATFCNKKLHGKPDLVKFYAAGVMEVRRWTRAFRGRSDHNQMNNLNPTQNLRLLKKSATSSNMSN
jgi:hypothetical protein